LTARAPAEKTRAMHFLVLALCLAASAPLAAEFTPEKPVTAELPPAGGARRVWLHDFAATNYSKAILYDADAGATLGTVDTGYQGMELELSAKGARFFAAETYLARGFRGARTDVITTFDAQTLLRTGEIEIPAKRLLGMPTSAHAALLDEERFLVVYNFSPASTVSVVDLVKQRFAGEIELAGCALVYPLGPRRFASLCGDGGVLELELDDNGKEQRRQTHPKLFDPAVDPLIEKAVRVGSSWLFVSFAGDVYVLDGANDGLAFGPRWSLTSDAEREERWLPGGLQPFALHAASGRLYALMHQGGPGTHKEPGEVVWVFDVAAKRRVQTLALSEPATSIAVSTDAAPLLYAAFLVSPALQVYDAAKGARLRTIESAAGWPALIQPVPGGAP
jgi:methylamine dehydrogenase heavy chain